MKSTLSQKLSPAFLGLACACTVGFEASVHAQITGTNEIAFTDWDTTNPGWSYGYFYQWNDAGARGTWTDIRNFIDPIIDPTNGPTVFQYTFEDVQYEDQVATNGGGFGTGFGTGLVWDYDSAKFTSLNLEDYILSWDARVEGLKPGQTTANCAMEFRLNSSASTPTRILQRAIGYNPGSNWTHFVFTLDAGAYGDNTTYATFTNGILNGITGIEFNQNQHMASDQFGFDSNNVIYMDNIKLEVISYAGPPPPPPPKVAHTIFDYNFDDRDVWYEWNTYPATGTGWSANANHGLYSAIRPDAGAGVGGSNGFAMLMDNSTIATDPPGIPQWAGGNVGSGGPCDFSWVVSGDVKNYRTTFSARVQGLAEGQTDAPLTVQLHFLAPDDTLQPPDSDTDRDLLLVLNIDATGITSNWLTFSYSLKDAVVNAGSLANFQAHYKLVDEITYQLQINGTAQVALWGTDADNKIVLDDFKLESLMNGAPPLTVTPSGGNVTLSWAALTTGGYLQLQSAMTAGGPYVDVPGATNSPVTLPHTNAAGFFRTHWMAQ